MKKILIMTASTGGGHNRAAKAIMEEIEKIDIGEEIECKIVDSFKAVNSAMDTLISRGYEMSAKYTPLAYGKVYSISDMKIFSHNEFKSHPITLLMARKLKKLIAKEKPDIVISTHAFPIVALSRIKRAYRGVIDDPDESIINDLFDEDDDVEEISFFPILISVLTDYTAHASYLQNEVDYYICGDDYVKELLIEDGIEEEKIKPYGIPVEKSFLESRDRSEVLNELGLDPDKKTVLLMGGSFGAGNIKGAFEDLLEIDRDIQILVIAGRNRSLKEYLDNYVSNRDDCKNVKVVGFTNNMNDILSSVDLLVTKPGGLTVTEALLKKVPMIIPYYIPGQEGENLDFLTNCGVAIRTTKKFSLKSVVKVLIDNPDRIDRIKDNIDSIRKLDSSENIAKLAEEILSTTRVLYNADI